MERLTDGLKKILLAGIGTVAVTAEKSKDVLDELVKKGELTVEQGKVLNEELKHNIKKTVKDNVNVSVKSILTGRTDRASWKDDTGAVRAVKRAARKDGNGRSCGRRVGRQSECGGRSSNKRNC